MSALVIPDGSTVSRTCESSFTGDAGSGLDRGPVHGEAVRGGVGARAVAVKRLHAPAHHLDLPVTVAQGGARPPGQEPQARPLRDLEHGDRMGGPILGDSEDEEISETTLN